MAELLLHNPPKRRGIPGLITRVKAGLVYMGKGKGWKSVRTGRKVSRRSAMRMLRAAMGKRKIKRTRTRIVRTKHRKLGRKARIAMLRARALKLIGGSKGVLRYAFRPKKKYTYRRKRLSIPKLVIKTGIRRAAKAIYRRSGPHKLTYRKK